MSKSRGLEFLPLLPMHLASQLKRRTSSSAQAYAGGLCLCPPTYAILPMCLASQLKRRTSSFAVAFAAAVGSIASPVCSVNSSNSSNSEDSDMIGEGVP